MMNGILKTRYVEKEHVLVAYPSPRRQVWGAFFCALMALLAVRGMSLLEGWERTVNIVAAPVLFVVAGLLAPLRRVIEVNAKNNTVTWGWSWLGLRRTATMPVERQRFGVIKKKRNDTESGGTITTHHVMLGATSMAHFGEDDDAAEQLAERLAQHLGHRRLETRYSGDPLARARRAQRSYQQMMPLFLVAVAAIVIYFVFFEFGK
ncbi:MAG: hypothetical protein AAF715_10845 [Myxococcota bacterium]